MPAPPPTAAAASALAFSRSALAFLLALLTRFFSSFSYWRYSLISASYRTLSALAMAWYLSSSVTLMSLHRLEISLPRSRNDTGCVSDDSGCFRFMGLNGLGVPPRSLPSSLSSPADFFFLSLSLAVLLVSILQLSLLLLVVVHVASTFAVRLDEDWTDEVSCRLPVSVVLSALVDRALLLLAELLVPVVVVVVPEKVVEVPPALLVEPPLVAAAAPSAPSRRRRCGAEAPTAALLLLLLLLLVMLDDALELD